MASDALSDQSPIDADTPRLRRGTVTTAGMIFLVVAATAPLTALSSNVSISIGLGAGTETVGYLVVVGALLALFAVGYLVLARYVVEPSAFAAFVTFGLGRRLGSAAAFVAALAYGLASTAMVAATGYFAELALASYLGSSPPWFVLSAVALGVVAVLGVRGLDIAQWVTALLCTAQFVIIVVLFVAVLVQRPASAWSPAGLLPTDPFSGAASLTLVFCLVCFGGYEATAVYGEEAQAPRQSIRRATFGALGLLLVVFAIGTWTLQAAHDDVVGVAAADAGALVPASAESYLGGWAGPVLSVMVAFGFLGAAIALHNMGSRYLFAMGRAGRLPDVLARVHPRHGTPVIGTAVLIVLTAGILIVFTAAGADPLTNLFPAVSGITSLSLVTLMLGCCVSVIVARLRGQVTEGPWRTIVAPVLAGAGFVVVLGAIAGNYATVTGSEHWVVAWMPLVPFLVAVYGWFHPGRASGAGVATVATVRYRTDVTSSAPLLFADHPQYWFETARVLGHSAYGGSEIGEVLATSASITAGDHDSWYDAWLQRADRVAEAARADAARGRSVSAREGFLRAANYYRNADFFLHADPRDRRVAYSYRLGVHCFEAAIAIPRPFEDAKAPSITPVRIPYEGRTLRGYLYRAATGYGEKRPTIVMHNGFDGSAEEMHFFGAEAAVERGFHVLTFDGPGQPGAVHDHGLTFRPDWENVVGPVLDFLLAEHGDIVDADRIALFGVSLGGVLAPRAAAFEPRIAAVVCNDGVYDALGAVEALLGLTRAQLEARWHDPAFGDEVEAAAAKQPTLRWALDHGLWVMGAADPAEFVRTYAQYNLLDGVAERISCPVLVCEAADDLFFAGDETSLSQPRQLMAHLSAPATLMPFTSDEGADAHCHVGAQRLASGRMLDWLAETFAADPADRARAEQPAHPISALERGGQQ
ncbi:amino acid permease [Nocardia sp. NPDC051750]|uniref:amino acid permease n=1 Tax=Nocardia sp. NPDC051750 TaxID=3364325 RepID=UPI0037B46D5B